MVRYVGLDVHKRFIEVCILDASGKPIYRGKVGCQREELIAFVKTKLKRTDCVALEATTNTWPLVGILRPGVKEVVVGNPLKRRPLPKPR